MEASLHAKPNLSRHTKRVRRATTKLCQPELKIHFAKIPAVQAIGLMHMILDGMTH